MSVSLAAPACIGGPFTLIDQDGRSVTDRCFQGRHVILYFGFTHCRVVCPRTLQRLSTALELTGQAGEGVQALYITVDPERDTPARLRDFLVSWPRFRGLTGSVEQIAAVRAAFRVHAVRRDTADGYDMPHSAVTHLIDADGRHIAHWLGDLSAIEIVERLGLALRDGRCDHRPIKSQRRGV